MRLLIILTALLMAGCQTTTPSGVRDIPHTTQIGEALPTPSLSLRSVSGLMGDIPQNTEASLRRLITAFQVMAFNIELGDKPSAIWNVRKWGGPISYVTTGPAAERVGVSAGKTLKILTDVTGVKFQRVHSVGVANFELYSGPSLRTGSKFYCIAGVDFSSSDGVIRKAAAHIGPDVGEAFDGCVHEELAQSLGLFNDQDVIEDSAFRPYDTVNAVNRSLHDTMTWSDAVLFRTLYDHRIKPGMTRAETVPIVRTIIGELLAELNG